MIQVDNISFAFAAQPIFKDLSFSVRKGEILSLLGPNGCGKSTLLRLLRGHLKVQSGSIHWDSEPIEAISTRKMALKVAMVPQSVHMTFPYTVAEVVAMGRYPHRRNILSFSRASDQKAINHALAMTDIVGLVDRPVTQLSGGELQRVFLARALAQNAEVLFLDEATSHLDIDHRLEFSRLLLRLNREQGTTIVQISHDIDLAAAISQRMLLLTEHGETAGIGNPQEVITEENIRRIFHVDVKIENNPFSGTPQIHPLLNPSVHQFKGLKIHLICGGGSGKTILRKLHLAAAELTVGPLNHGDSDESVATALDIPMAEESPFRPYSRTVLDKTWQMITRAEIVIIATSWWGTGNLDCLKLAHRALEQEKKVYLVNPQKTNDYTQGEAWEQICRLKNDGAVVVEREEALLEMLKKDHACSEKSAAASR